MALNKDHALNKKMLSRNMIVAGILLGFAGLVFALTVVKVTDQPMEGFDHVLRPSITVPESE